MSETNAGMSVMATEAIQEACIRAKARLVNLPDGPERLQESATIELAGGKVLQIPMAVMVTDKNRDAAIGVLVSAIKDAAEDRTEKTEKPDKPEGKAKSAKKDAAD